MKRNCRDDGCCCIFDEDGETQLEWCKIHAAMRDRIREQRKLLDECEKALAGLFGECDNHLTNKESWDKARATLAKLRSQEKADEVATDVQQNAI